MRRTHAYTSWLAPAFERYVALRRATGAKYEWPEYRLRAFDRYLAATAPGPPLERETLIRYLASLDGLSPQARDNVVVVLWPALSHARRHGVPIEPLPPRPPRPSRQTRRRPPRLVTRQEAARLIAAARRLTPRAALRPATLATLIGLLYTSGLRIGEALGLDVGDLDRRDRILTVRRGKFGKSRAIPLRRSTCEALVRYVEDARRPVGTGPSAPLFVSGIRRRLAYPTARPCLYAACRIAGIAKPWPRPHDFRHTFAVGRVAAWYRQGRDVDALLPALSTYLGHVSVEGTRLYLIANGGLLEQAGSRFEHWTRALDEVPS